MNFLITPCSQLLHYLTCPCLSRQHLLIREQPCCKQHVPLLLDEVLLNKSVLHSNCFPLFARRCFLCLAVLLIFVTSFTPAQAFLTATANSQGRWPENQTIKLNSFVRAGLVIIPWELTQHHSREGTATLLIFSSPS